MDSPEDVLIASLYTAAALCLIPNELPIYHLGVFYELHSAGSAAINLRGKLLLLSVLLLCAVSAHAQGKKPNPGQTSCANEIPVGVKVIRLPDAEQHKVTVSDFSIMPGKGAATYDLAMRIKNGTSWCVTSLALTYSLGDARGQEWVANEYPAVVEFKTQPDTPAKDGKSAPPGGAPSHSVGMTPGKEEKRVVFDLYDYIQPRPTGYFDGSHLISAEMKYCMGYIITKAQ